ncbi:hypothetical protein SEA_GARDENB_64 [Microbacterium phage GardenB]|nr:hypothetical protein SEA_GARDENB_64 [Microbacterium phage GardenB]
MSDTVQPQRLGRVLEDLQVPTLGQQTQEALGLAPAKQVAQLRVRATWRVIDRQWGELTLEVKDPIVDKWLPLSADPVRVARRFSGKDGDRDREAPELTAVAFLRKVLGRDKQVRVLRLSGQEERVGAGVTDWRYWACLSAPLTVGLVHQYDGSVAVVGV